MDCRVLLRSKGIEITGDDDRGAEDDTEGVRAIPRRRFGNNCSGVISCLAGDAENVGDMGNCREFRCD